ncbi:TetR/AcrR family transcriptional regulator [Nocardia zapadnayensis]|uniref:TetR/AcrR family transcriptional regulator n=1 Tax=Nocardia rhamnosiphila TaxID=426716 RepID=UPI00224520D1|nr:TetR/AcrR family transcriptional regulator [Nocardia zapadnayensis]MCX0269858.1 TetR/AcrR family transcriptional regulator [Nocardia zapadnayensis]
MPSSDANSNGPTRERILRATFEVLSRHGHSKLNLSDVAAAAKVSRPTLYRFFSSKDELLAAFGRYEQQNTQDAFAAATEGLAGAARLDAALRYMVDHQESYSLGRLVDVEPDHVLAELARVMPTMRALIRPMVEGADADIVAAAIIRLAACHYVVRGDDRATFLAQLRHVAGIPPGGLKIDS